MAKLLKHHKRTSNMKKPDICFIYDGDCPICQAGMEKLDIREDIGNTQRLNKRIETEHSTIKDAMDQNFDLNDGLIIKYQGQFHQGADALHVISQISNSNTLSGFISKILFHYKWSAYLLYPFIRALRYCLIKLKGRKVKM